MPTRSRRPARQPSAAASPTAIPATATASWTSRRPAPGRLDGWPRVLTISSGHSAEYLTAAVAAGRENYYTGAVAAGEPPGRWYGAGAEALGLTGLVSTQDMTALYERYLDPATPPSATRP